jgi:hypothetical protein
MAQRKAWTRWFRLWGPKRPAIRRVDDFADYGTAFGLDMSLAASQADSPASLPGRAAPTPAAEQPRYGASS